MKKCNKGFIVPLLVAIIVLLVAGGGYSVYKNESAKKLFKTMPFEQATSTSKDFSETGNLVKNNTGLKMDIWYLIYEKPGAPALKAELSIPDKLYSGLYVGERAKVTGTLNNGIVQVNTITPLDVNIQQVSTTTEKATGIIKSLYTKDGKNYMDIDYVTLNSDWQPTGDTGDFYTNTNTKIRTFEISANFKTSGFHSLSDPISSFSDLQNYLKLFEKNTGWPDIVTVSIVNGVVVDFVGITNTP